MARQTPGASREALARAGTAPLVLEAKEGLALLNGTHLMAGLGALAVLDALRPHPGQLASAANLRRLTEASAIIASHRDCTRVQDAYSLRCMPQVHGAVREAIGFARAVLERELGAVSDNPLVFPPEGGTEGVVLSGGNFHGEVLGLVRSRSPSSRASANGGSTGS